MMLSDLKVGDSVWRADWTSTRAVLSRYEIVKVTSHGWTAKYVAQVDDKIGGKEIGGSTLNYYFQRSSTWFGPNSRIYFKNQEDAINRLIWRRELYISRLEGTARLAQMDIDNLKRGCFDRATSIPIMTDRDIL
jgi:hypothetical protein